MTIKMFRRTVMTIAIVVLVELVAGIFYYFIFLNPEKQLESLRLRETTLLNQKKLEKDRALEELEIREKTRMEEIRLEVKRIDLEQAKINRIEEEGAESEKLRLENEENTAKQASLSSCMKIVVENYHNQWNFFCEQLELPPSCFMPEKYSVEINSDYEIGKQQCEDFFDK